MGLIECPDCDGKVSDIAPACPHCGRPFNQKKVVQVPAQAPQKGFEHSATESVFKAIWDWWLLQKKIFNICITVFIVFSLAAILSLFIYLLLFGLLEQFDFAMESVKITNLDDITYYIKKPRVWVYFVSAAPALMFNVWLTWWIVSVKKARFRLR